MSLQEMITLCLRHLTPREVLGGFSPNDGLSKTDLVIWCGEIGLPTNATKPELIDGIIGYYDTIMKIEPETDDPRELYFTYFEAIANREYDLLRKQGVIEKDLDCEHLFEEATDYIFEKMLGHKPLIMKGTDHPDGMLSFNDRLIMWDNKSKERMVNLLDHINQFDKYIRSSDKNVPVFIVIGPDFTDNSTDECVKYAANNDTLILLIKASELKELAIKWKELHKNDDIIFPLGFFKQNGRFSSKGIF